MKRKSTAGLLALTLGGIGVHHFYLGSYGYGLLYLLLSFTFLPLIFSILEAINFFTMTSKVFNERYNQDAIERQELLELMKQRNEITDSTHTSSTTTGQGRSR